MSTLAGLAATNASEGSKGSAIHRIRESFSLRYQREVGKSMLNRCPGGQLVPSIDAIHPYAETENPQPVQVQLFAKAADDVQLEEEHVPANDAPPSAEDEGLPPLDLHTRDIPAPTRNDPVKDSLHVPLHRTTDPLQEWARLSDLSDMPRDSAAQQAQALGAHSLADWEYTAGDCGFQAVLDAVQPEARRGCDHKALRRNTVKKVKFTPHLARRAEGGYTTWARYMSQSGVVRDARSWTDPVALAGMSEYLSVVIAVLQDGVAPSVYVPSRNCAPRDAALLHFTGVLQGHFSPLAMPDELRSLLLSMRAGIPTGTCDSEDLMEHVRPAENSEGSFFTCAWCVDEVDETLGHFACTRCGDCVCEACADRTTRYCHASRIGAAAAADCGAPGPRDDAVDEGAVGGGQPSFHAPPPVRTVKVEVMEEDTADGTRRGPRDDLAELRRQQQRQWETDERRQAARKEWGAQGGQKLDSWARQQGECQRRYEQAVAEGAQARPEAGPARASSPARRREAAAGGMEVDTREEAPQQLGPDEPAPHHAHPQQQATDPETPHTQRHEADGATRSQQELATEARLVEAGNEGIRAYLRNATRISPIPGPSQSDIQTPGGEPAATVDTPVWAVPTLTVAVGSAEELQLEDILGDDGILWDPEDVTAVQGLYPTVSMGRVIPTDVFEWCRLFHPKQGVGAVADRVRPEIVLAVFTEWRDTMRRLRPDDVLFRSGTVQYKKVRSTLASISTYDGAIPPDEMPRRTMAPAAPTPGSGNSSSSARQESSVQSASVSPSLSSGNIPLSARTVTTDDDAMCTTAISSMRSSVRGFAPCSSTGSGRGGKGQGSARGSAGGRRGKGRASQ